MPTAGFGMGCCLINFVTGMRFTRFIGLNWKWTFEGLFHWVMYFSIY